VLLPLPLHLLHLLVMLFLVMQLIKLMTGLVVTLMQVRVVQGQAVVVVVVEEEEAVVVVVVAAPMQSTTSSQHHGCSWSLSLDTLFGPCGRSRQTVHNTTLLQQSPWWRSQRRHCGCQAVVVTTEADAASAVVRVLRLRHRPQAPVATMMTHRHCGQWQSWPSIVFRASRPTA